MANRGSLVIAGIEPCVLGGTGLPARLRYGERPTVFGDEQAFSQPFETSSVRKVTYAGDAVAARPKASAALGPLLGKAFLRSGLISRGKSLGGRQRPVEPPTCCATLLP